MKGKLCGVGSRSSVINKGAHGRWWTQGGPFIRHLGLLPS